MGDKPASFSPASLLDALNRHHVAYVLIGRVAARARGATLRTGDQPACAGLPSPSPTSRG
jgi:hypothetical protein